MFRIDRQLAWFPNHTIDAGNGGRALCRLPDRTLVYAEDYPAKLAEYLANQARPATSAEETGPGR